MLPVIIKSYITSAIQKGFQYFCCDVELDHYDIVPRLYSKEVKFENLLFICNMNNRYVLWNANTYYFTSIIKEITISPYLMALCRTELLRTAL